MICYTYVMNIRKSAIQSIDVRGLPEPAVASLQQMAHAFRQVYPKPRRASRRHSVNNLIRKEGHVIGDISRRTIYGDVG